VAQSIAGTNLATSWAASAQTVSFAVTVDWGRADSWTDETAYVLSVQCETSIYDRMTGLPALGETMPARATIRLKNDTNRFSPDKGTIAAIADGIYRVPVRVSAGYVDATNGAEVLRQFTGEIESAKETETRGQKIVACECVDAGVALLQYKHTSEMYTDQRTDSFIGTLLTAAGITDTALEAGFVELPYAWVDTENLWSEIVKAAAAEGGLVHFAKDGECRFWRLTHFLEAAASTTSQATLDRGNARYLDDTTSWRDSYTGVNVEWIPREVGALSVLYQAHEPIAVRPGETVTHDALYQYPAYSAKTPVANTDYQAVSAGMKDLSADLAVAVTGYAQRATLAFTNNNATHTIYVLNLQVRGKPLEAEEAQSIQRDTTLSPAKVPGVKVYPVSGNNYLQTLGQAHLLAGYLRDRLQYPRRLLQWEGVACPWIEPGDRVRIDNADAGISAQYCYVLNVTQSMSTSGYQQTLLCLPVENVYAHSDYFRLNVSAWANTGSHKVGY
jgi:hypothetical protein